MTGSGPALPEREHLARWRRARREVARRHHPDLGGDAETYLTRLAEVDARFGRGTPPANRPVVTVRLRRITRARRRIRGSVTAVSGAVNAAASSATHALSVAAERLRPTRRSTHRPVDSDRSSHGRH